MTDDVYNELRDRLDAKTGKDILYTCIKNEITHRRKKHTSSLIKFGIIEKCCDEIWKCVYFNRGFLSKGSTQRFTGISE